VENHANLGKARTGRLHNPAHPGQHRIRRCRVRSKQLGAVKLATPRQYNVGKGAADIDRKPIRQLGLVDFVRRIGLKIGLIHRAGIIYQERSKTPTLSLSSGIANR